MVLAVARVLPEVDVHRDGVGSGPAGCLLLLDHLGIRVEQRGESRRVLVGDLLEAGAELGVVLLRVAERLFGRPLALLAELVGHPQVEPVEQAAVAAERVGPLALADQCRELLQPASEVVRVRPEQEVRGGSHLLGVRVLRGDAAAAARRHRRQHLEVLVTSRLALQRSEQLLRGHGSPALNVTIDGTLGGHGRLELCHRL